MTIEMINSLSDTNSAGVRWQIEQVRLGLSSALWFATPHEDAVYLVKKLGINPKKVYDIYAQSYLSDSDDTKGIWWTNLLVPSDAQFVINTDWTKNIMQQGRESASLRWFSDAQRIVQAVIWKDLAGKIDYKDIYRRDGKLFAKQYFSSGELLVSDFYFGQQAVQVQDFYFNKKRNLVYAGGESFSTAEAYLKAGLRLSSATPINITQLDREVDLVPPHTTLTLIAGVLDDQGQIAKKLVDILQDDTHAIDYVQVTQTDFEFLQRNQLPTKKLHIKTF